MAVGLDMSTLMPGMNPSGTNQAVPTSMGAMSPAMGGTSNPFLPSFPSGNSMPGSSNPMGNMPNGIFNMGNPGSPVQMNGAPAQASVGGGGMDLNSFIAQIMQQGFPANGVGPGTVGAPGAGGAPGAQGGPGQNFANSLGFGGVGGSWTPNQNDFIKAMHKAGFSAGDAALLYNFVASGAGFNQGIVNQLFAAMQPGIQRGEADIAEHFGAMGLGMSSPAAIGFGDFLSQVNLNQGQLEAAMMEQATQNYMNVLMQGKGPAPQNMFQNLMEWLNVSSNAVRTAEGH